MQQLAGHRCVCVCVCVCVSPSVSSPLEPHSDFSAVGGIRASLYNAVTMEEVDALVALMTEFHRTFEAPAQ
jgi:hypothetical protein